MRSFAKVVTQRPARYAKQLATHLGRKCHIRSEVDGEVVVLGGAECLLYCGEGYLELRACAENLDALDRIKHVVGGHLERFGVKDDLQVSWVVAATTDDQGGHPLP